MTEKANIDLSADTPTETDSQPESESKSQVQHGEKATQLNALAQDHAQELLQEADGNNAYARAQNARETISDQLETLEQATDQLESRLEQINQQYEQLGESMSRIESQRDSDTVIQTLAGGISVEVPPDTEDVDTDFTRPDLLNQLEEQRLELEQTQQTLENKIAEVDTKHQIVVKAEESISQYEELSAPNQPADNLQGSFADATPVNQAQNHSVDTDGPTDAMGFPIDGSE